MRLRLSDRLAVMVSVVTCAVALNHTVDVRVIVLHHSVLGFVRPGIVLLESGAAEKCLRRLAVPVVLFRRII